MIYIKNLSLPKKVIINELDTKACSAIVFTGALGSIKISLYDNNLQLLKKDSRLYLISRFKKGRKKNVSFNFAFCAIKQGLSAVFFPAAFYLKLVGVGFKVIALNNRFELSLGYSHTIKLAHDSDIAFFTKKEGRVPLLGLCSFSLNSVTNRLAQISAYQKPSVYTGKGLVPLDSEPSRKEGKGKFQR